jgi:hypothetical protein
MFLKKKIKKTKNKKTIFITILLSLTRTFVRIEGVGKKSDREV